MAILHPATFDQIRQDAGLFRELDVMERLKQSLPGNYEVFHSISWFSIHNSHDQHGEIDIVVMSPEGNLVLLEVKAGEVILRNGEIFKIYHGKESSVTRQSKLQYSAMLTRLTDAKLHPFVTNCLVLPDYTINDADLISFPKERITSAENYDYLGTRIQEILRSVSNREDVEAIRHFLMNEFRVTADLTVIKGQIGSAIQRLSDGMSTWVPRITSPSGVIRINGTAGSGKTQLALQLLNDAAVSKHKSLYVCFNRSLADYMAKIAPASAHVTNFHELSVESYRRKFGDPDFSNPQIFELAAAHYIDYISTQAPMYDLIIIDEGQDFQPDWVTCIISQLKDDGRLYLMEDPDQRLYTRDEFDIADAVLLICNDNFRSPHSVCQTINAFRLSSKPIEAKSPYKGDLPEFYTYPNEDALIQTTSLAIESLLKRGFEIGDITVLTGKGRIKSKILNADHIGRFSTRHFTGEYTVDGDPVWSSGDLLTETIYRFKGQSAPAIVLSEIDFSEITEIERNKLFVGLTRAQMAVAIVLSGSAEKWFGKQLS